MAGLKASPGMRGILIPGSISVVQQLLAAGLVDELRLLVHPVAARKGRKLFDEGAAPYHLKVLATEVFPTVLIRVTLDPRQHAPTAAALGTRTSGILYRTLEVRSDVASSCSAVLVDVDSGTESREELDVGWLENQAEQLV